MNVDVFVDGCDEGWQTGKGIAADALVGDFCEPAFDLIEPGGAGGREVQVIAWPFFEPRGDLGSLVGAVVVHDDMDVAARGHTVIDLVEKMQKLLLTMASVASANDFAGSDVERRKE